MSPSTTAGSASRYPWVAMGIILTGSYMAVLDGMIVNIALPKIADALGARGAIEAVVTAYLLSVGIVQLAAGWISDRFGKKHAFVGGLVLFLIGSALAAAAPNLAFLVACRVIQGLGGGVMMPVGLAMIYELFPPGRRGIAVGVWGVAIMVGPAMGPIIGGWIATTYSWRWIFAFKIPFGVAGLLLSVRYLRDVGFREARRFNFGSLAFAATGLVGLLLAFDKVANWGWGSPAFLLLAGTGLGTLAMFARRELRSSDPLLELSMYRISPFTLTTFIMLLLGGAVYARALFMPLLLQIVYGLSPLEAGLMLTPAAIAMAITMPIGGRITDRIGPRVPVVVGSAMSAVALWMLVHISPATPLAAIAGMLILEGLGSGLGGMPNMVSAMNALPNQYLSRASALRTINRQVFAALSVAALASIVAARVDSITGRPGTTALELQAAYSTVFWVAFVGAFAAMLLGFRLPNSERTRSHLATRVAEYAEVETSLSQIRPSSRPRQAGDLEAPATGSIDGGT